MKKSNILWMAVGSLITILIIMCYTFFTSYQSNIVKMLGADVVYKHEWFHTHLSSDICDYIEHGKKITLFFGELPSKDEAIWISAPGWATLYIYPSDEESLIVRYEPRNGIKRNYKLSGYGNFDKVSNAFYELTGHEVFKVNIK